MKEIGLGGKHRVGTNRFAVNLDAPGFSEIGHKMCSYPRDYFPVNLELKKKSKGLPRQAEVAQGVPGRLRPRTFLTFRHYKGGRSSAKRTGRLYPRRNTWYSLSEAQSTSGHMVLSGEPRKKSPVVGK